MGASKNLGRPSAQLRAEPVGRIRRCRRVLGSKVCSACTCSQGSAVWAAHFGAHRLQYNAEIAPSTHRSCGRSIGLWWAIAGAQYSRLLSLVKRESRKMRRMHARCYEGRVRPEGSPSMHPQGLASHHCAASGYKTCMFIAKACSHESRQTAPEPTFTSGSPRSA